MSHKLNFAGTVLLGLMTLASAVAGDEFADDFDTDHDYLADGTAGRGWDGFLGTEPRETSDQIATADGKLFLQSTR